MGNEDFTPPGIADRGYPAGAAMAKPLYAQWHMYVLGDKGAYCFIRFSEGS